MPIYRTTPCPTLPVNGIASAPAYLPDGRMAVLPVIYVRAFDPAIPGAFVSVREYAIGRVIDVEADGRILVQWLAGPAGECWMRPSDVQFVEYAAQESPLDTALCTACKKPHHPNVRCSARVKGTT